MTASAPEALVVRRVGPDQMRLAMAIRVEVFVAEQHVPADLEADERDAEATHVLAWLGGRPVGTGRLVREQPGYAGVEVTLGSVAHLGRLAVRASARRAGVGGALVRALHAEARAAGLTVAYLGAQHHAVGFYQRLGYTAYGEPFDDAGIVHRHMCRTLGSLTPAP